MPFEQKFIEIPSYTGTILKQRLAGEGSSKRLVVLLPGVGYLVSSPLLHFLSQVAWGHGDDVLNVQYGFQVSQREYEPEHQGEISQESLATIEAALKLGYEELYIIGKSIGTPMAAFFANQLPQAKKLILLTPIQKAHQFVQATPSLAVIGTGDAQYAPELSQDTELVKWKVYAGLNHSLEYPNKPVASIGILQNIIADCEAFLYS